MCVSLAISLDRIRLNFLCFRYDSNWLVWSSSWKRTCGSPRAGQDS